MKKLGAIIASLIIPLFIFILLPTLFIRQRVEYINENFIQSFSLTAITPYKFDYTPQHNQITQIDIQLKNPNLSNTSLITLSINSDNYDYQTSFTGFNIGDPSWIQLKIPPLNSSNKPVHLSLTTNNVVSDKLFVTTDKLGSPNLKIYYQSTGIKNNLIYQYQQFKSRNLPFTIFYISLIILLNYLYLRKHD